jgi:hypothetical protein
MIYPTDYAPDREFRPREAHAAIWRWADERGLRLWPEYADLAFSLHGRRATTMRALELAEAAWRTWRGCTPEREAAAASFCLRYMEEAWRLSNGRVDWFTLCLLEALPVDPCHRPAPKSIRIETS